MYILKPHPNPYFLFERYEENLGDLLFLFIYGLPRINVTRVARYIYPDIRKVHNQFNT